MAGIARAIRDEAPPTILFRSDGLVVRAYLGRPSPLCFVVFDPMVEATSLDRPAFAETFLAAYDQAAVHILAARNHWYQDAALPAALAAVREATRGFGRVVAYGSSMGGYAALRFSRDVGAQAVIAISPQYSVRPGAAIEEKRWLALRRDLPWLHEQPGERLPAVAEATILYDNRGLDRAHADAIRNDLPDSRLVPLAYAGHPAGAMLAEAGLLSAAILDAAQGRLCTRTLVAAARRQRHRSGHYLYTLARRQPFWRLRTKLALARRAVACRPDEPVYLTYAALVADCCDLSAAALPLHARATAIPGNGMGELRYARSLWRAGRIAEARAAAERARPLFPLDGAPVEIIALAQALADAPGAALATLAGDPRVTRQPRLARLLLALGESRAVRTHIARAAGRAIARWQVRRSALDRRNLPRELVHADWD